MAKTGSLRHNLKPNGECWCGCGGVTALGKFLIPGHDSYARKAVLEREFGDTVDLLDALGYGPGRRNAVTGEEPTAGS
jgi:hypothetical protein